MSTGTKKPIIAVVGSSGKVGSSIVKVLSTRYHVIPLHRTSKRYPINIIDKNSVYRELLVLKNMNVKTVINAAGNVHIDEEEYTRGDINSNMYKVNVIGAKNIAIGCYKNNINLIHLSTEYVFDGTKPKGQTYSENDDTNIDLLKAPSWYGITKALGEKEVLHHHAKGSMIVRLSQVQSKTSGIFARSIQLLHSHQHFTRVANQLIAPISAHTAATNLGMIEQAMATMNIRGFLHVSSFNSHSVYNACLLVAQAYNIQNIAHVYMHRTTLEKLMTRKEQIASRPKNSILNISLFESYFGKSHLVSVEKEVQRYHLYYSQ